MNQVSFRNPYFSNQRTIAPPQFTGFFGDHNLVLDPIRSQWLPGYSVKMEDLENRAQLVMGTLSDLPVIIPDTIPMSRLEKPSDSWYCGRFSPLPSGSEKEQRVVHQGQLGDLTLEVIDFPLEESSWNKQDGWRVSARRTMAIYKTNTTSQKGIIFVNHENHYPRNTSSNLTSYPPNIHVLTAENTSNAGLVYRKKHYTDTEPVLVQNAIDAYNKLKPLLVAMDNSVPDPEWIQALDLQG